MQTKKRYLFIFILILSALVLGACAPQVPVTGEEMAKDDSAMMEDKDDSMMDSHDDADMDKDDMMDDSMEKDDSMMDEAKDDEMMDDKHDDDAMMDSPAWFSHSFTNVNSGESFSINDYKGKVVLVETLATWCSNCLRQQTQVKELHEMLGDRDDFVSFGLGIDIYEDPDTLASYINKQGFDWVYAISDENVAREIGNLYGSQFLNPPSTPMLIIDRDGKVHTLDFGIKSAEDLKEALMPFLDGSM